MIASQLWVFSTPCFRFRSEAGPPHPSRELEVCGRHRGTEGLLLRDVMLQVLLDPQQLVELTELTGGQLRLVKAIELLELVQQFNLVRQVVLLPLGVDVLPHDFVWHDRL